MNKHKRHVRDSWDSSEVAVGSAKQSSEKGKEAKRPLCM
jgi:hypothetical protein